MATNRHTLALAHIALDIAAAAAAARQINQN